MPVAAGSPNLTLKASMSFSGSEGGGRRIRRTSTGHYALPVLAVERRAATLTPAQVSHVLAESVEFQDELYELTGDQEPAGRFRPRCHSSPRVFLYKCDL